MELIELIGKAVEVSSTETTYTGTLIEVNDDEVYLLSESGWIMIPIEKVVSITEKED